MSNQPPSLRDATIRLFDYCRDRSWAGYDPYDALNSRLFQKLTFLHSRWPRLVLTQLLKRSPLNLRPLLGIPRDVNPKGIALFLSSAVRLQRCGLVNETETRDLTQRLVSLRSPGWRRSCWGYNFEWQARDGLVPRGYPNIICTSFAAEALLDAHEVSQDPVCLSLATDSGRFLLEELKGEESDDGFCFTYTPLGRSRVHNANLLGAALLARLFSKTRIAEFRDAALASARYAIRQQRSDGSWLYGEEPFQNWIDSFHTGYNLLALKSVADHLDYEPARASLLQGFDFYRNSFFAPGGVVKYYHDRVYPIDAHAVAHGILTLAELASLHPDNLAVAREIVDWTMRYMLSPSGFFYYRKGPWLTNRVNYVRWTQAWMLTALTSLVVHDQSANACAAQNLRPATTFVPETPVAR